MNESKVLNLAIELETKTSECYYMLNEMALEKVLASMNSQAD